VSNWNKSAMTFLRPNNEWHHGNGGEVARRSAAFAGALPLCHLPHLVFLRPITSSDHPRNLGFTSTELPNERWRCWASQRASSSLSTERATAIQADRRPPLERDGSVPRRRQARRKPILTEHRRREATRRPTPTWTHCRVALMKNFERREHPNYAIIPMG
jgi:hypothetical protein